MADQTLDPWKRVQQQVAMETYEQGGTARVMSAIDAARDAERQQHQQEIARLMTMGLPQRVADLMLADAHADADIIKALTAEIEQHQQTIQQQAAQIDILKQLLHEARSQASLLSTAKAEIIDAQAAQIETLTQALEWARTAFHALTPGHRTGYDWNADPLFLTRVEGDALTRIELALAGVPSPSPPVERLMWALRNIRMVAARVRGFGHQATPQTAEKMAAKKDAALDHVLRLCAEVGVVGSILREAGASRPTEGEQGRLGNYYGRRLTASIEDGQVLVAIGVQTLAHAVAYADWANPFDEASDDYIRTFAIADAGQFAKDVVSAMLAEREDGSTPLSDFLDKMSQAAIEDGSLGLHEDEHRIKHGETAPCETWAEPEQGAPQ